MLDIRKILYPTDFSESAARALPHALRLAQAHGAEVHLLHALVLHAADEAELERRYEELAEEARRELEELAGEDPGQGPEAALLLIPAVRRGISAAPAILDYAAEADVDLIAMGSHGRRGIRRMLVGSVAEEVVRTAACPVLTVRSRNGEPGEMPEFRRIVVPVDFSEHSRLAVECAAELAAAFGARVDLLHVVEEPVYPEFYLPVSAPAFELPELRARAEERLRELAAGVEAGVPEGGVPAGVEVRAGRSATEIAEFAKERRADLIVIASHGLHGLDRVLLGSVTERLMRHAPCSVLTVKAFGKRLRPRSAESGSEASSVHVS